MPQRSVSTTIKLALLLGTLGAVGCATPAPIVRLEPVLSPVTWTAGRPSMEKEAGGVRVSAGFDHHDGYRLAVHVVIDNRGTDVADANPRDISYSECTTERSASCAVAQYAIDPEEVLTSLEVEQSRQTAQARNSEAALGALVVLSAVTDVATVASGRATATTGLGTAGAIALSEQASADHAAAGATVSEERRRWSTEALRRTTLQPGTYAAGLVYVPTNMEAHYLWFHIRVGGQVFSFPFRQTIKQVHIQ